MSLCYQRRAGSVSTQRTPFTCPKTSSRSPPRTASITRGFRDRLSIGILTTGTILIVYPRARRVTRRPCSPSYTLIMPSSAISMTKWAVLPNCWRPRICKTTRSLFFLSDNGYHLLAHMVLAIRSPCTRNPSSADVAFGAGVKPGLRTARPYSAAQVYSTLIELATPPRRLSL